MKAAGLVLRSVAIAACLSGCSLIVVEHDLVPAGSPVGQPAILEYKLTGTSLSRVSLVEVDGRHVDTKSPRATRYLFKLASGRHRVRFRGEEGFPVHPEVVEFEAEAGKRYVPGFERINHKETDGSATALYFNFVSPKIVDERAVKVAAAASAPFTTGLDAQKNVLLYEETTLPKEQTARVYCKPEGLLKVPGFSIARIAGRSGETRVEYERTWFDLSQYYHMLPGSWSDPWQLRLLPGEYRFDLTMAGLLEEAQSGVPVRGPIKSITLNAEAGHTYRINPNSENVNTRFDKDAIGRTRMTNTLRWNPVFEDVTGKRLVDE
jgi:hypothetical protein